MFLLLLLNFLHVTNAIISYSLVLEFSVRQFANTLILFSCNVSESADLFAKLGQTFPGPVHLFQQSSDRFYNDHQRFMAVRYHQIAVVADFRCNHTDKLINFSSENAYFNASYRWLFFAEGDLRETVEVFKMQNLNIDSRVTLAVSTCIECYDIYELFGTVHRRGGKMHVVMVGTKINTSDISWKCSMSSYYARDNLGGITLQAAVVSVGFNHSYTFDENIKSMLPPKTYVGSRIGYQMVQLLKRRLNFRTQHIIVPDFGFEYIGTNSSKGVVGKLQRNLVDLGISPLAVTKERIGIFDQTVPIATFRIMIIFRHPKNTGERSIFLQPFGDGVWVAIGAVLLTSMGMFSLIFFVRDRKPRLSYGQLTFITFGLYCLQSFSEKIAFIPSRMILLTVVLFSILVYQFYSCFIIGYLLVLPPKTIRTLDQLLTSNLKLSIEDISYNYDFFKRTNIPVARELYEKKVLSNEFGFTNVTTGIALVKRGGYAFHCDNTYGNTFIMETFNEHEICELQVIQLFPPREIHLNVPKGSPLKEVLRVTLRRLQEIGLTEYYQRKLVTKRPPCMKQNMASVQVRFEDMFDLCLLLAIGVATSVAILLVELIEFRVRKYHEMKEFAKHYTGWLD